MHALAKANIFIIVGNLIHAQFSQQDLRFMPSGFQRKVISLFSFVRIFRLRGLVFSSGFFSKDLILIYSYSEMNRALNRFLFFTIVSLTFAYCLKLLLGLRMKSERGTTEGTGIRIAALLPSLILRTGRLLIGQI